MNIQCLFSRFVPPFLCALYCVWRTSFLEFFYLLISWILLFKDGDTTPPENVTSLEWIIVLEMTFLFLGLRMMSATCMAAFDMLNKQNGSKSANHSPLAWPFELLAHLHRSDMKQIPHTSVVIGSFQTARRKMNVEWCRKIVAMHVRLKADVNLAIWENNFLMWDGLEWMFTVQVLGEGFRPPY